MKEKDELCEEPKEMEKEGEEGVTAKMAKQAEAAKKNPPQEGV